MKSYLARETPAISSPFSSLTAVYGRIIEIKVPDFLFIIFVTALVLWPFHLFKHLFIFNYQHRVHPNFSWLFYFPSTIPRRILSVAALSHGFKWKWWIKEVAGAETSDCREADSMQTGKLDVVAHSFISYREIWTTDCVCLSLLESKGWILQPHTNQSLVTGCGCV